MSKFDKYVSLDVNTNMPTPHTFTVPIQETPLWKIKAVAQYKLARHQRKRGRNSDMFIPKQSPLRPEYSEQYEMALDRRAHEIRKEMTAMNSARISLMWLLKKTTEYDTKRNHSAEQQC